MDKHGDNQMIAYWIIEGVEAKAKWDKLVAGAEQKRAIAREWMISLGGTGSCMRDGHSLVHIIGVEFETTPEKNWKENKSYPGYYIPKKTSKLGKQLEVEMSELRVGLSRILVGITFLGHGEIFDAGAIYWCGWELTDKGIILKAKEGEGETQWTPIEGLRRLKDSEYWAINEAQKQAE